MSETKTKLDTLKEAEKQVQKQFEEGKVSQQQYDALQREIVSTEQELQKLEDAADKSNAAIAKISATADKVSEGAQKIADKTKALSAAAAGAAAGLGAMAVNAGAAADDINTLAKQSGFGTDEIQKWQYAADRIDVSVDDIVGAAKKMKKNMVSNSKDVTAAWNKLGVSVVDSNGQIRDANDVFYESIEALSKIPNETERDILAMQLFGKSADSLAGIIDDGGAALKEMGAEAEKSGLILSQDALDGANAFNDGIDTLKAKAQQAFMSSGAALAENLLPYMEKLVDKISDVLSWLANLDGSTLAIIGSVLLVIASISPLMSLISNITLAVKGVSAAISFLSANPIVLLIGAIVALVALIAVKGDEIQAILQKVDDFLQNIFLTDWTKILGPGLGDVLNAFFANFKNIWDSIKQIFDGIIDFIRGVFTGDWERVWQGVLEIFGGIFSGLEAMLKAPLNGVIGLVNGVISGINYLIEKVNGINLPLIGDVNISTIPKIPYLAKGGILSQGSAIVGEAGPELLTVSGSRAIVQPLTGNSGVSAVSSESINLLNEITVQIGNEQFKAYVVNTAKQGLSSSQFAMARAKGRA